MQKLLIAESSDAFRTVLEDALFGKYKIKSCSDGKTAAALLTEFQPDLMILDILLPELDGITLLEGAIHANIRPAVLATTRYVNSYVVERLTRMSVSYVMAEPCDIDAVVVRLRDLHKRISPDLSAEEKQAISGKILLQLGFSNKLHGFYALKIAIPIFASDPSQRLSKELYPEVARILGDCSALQVEHSIRMAIKAAWDNRDEESWNQFFPEGFACAKERPSNRTFIAALSERFSEKIFQMNR